MIVLGWGKPLGYDRGVVTPFHAIVAINYYARDTDREHGAFVTACRGSWRTDEERFDYRPLPLLVADERDLDISERTVFVCVERGHLFRDPACLACIDELRKTTVDRFVCRAAELEHARRQGIELLRASETY